MDSVLPQHLWRRAPATTRVVCLAYILLSLTLPMLSDRVPVAPKLLLCCFHTVLRKRYVWAMGLSWVYKPAQDVGSLVLVCADIYLAAIYMRRKERQMGSFRFFIWILYVNTAVNFIYLVLMLALATKCDSFETQCNQGMWPILLVIITRQSLTNPAMSLTFLRVVRVQQKWYPILLGIFLTCISCMDAWMILAALAFGYMESCMRVEKYYLSPAAASKLDRACLGGIMSKCMCFFAKRLGKWLPAPGQQAYEDGGLMGMACHRPGWTLSMRLPMVLEGESNSAEQP